MENWVVCKHCEEEFDANIPHHRAKGLINECRSCARHEVVRHVGRADAACKAGAGIEIFRGRTAVAIARAVIRAECGRGFNANLTLGSPTSAFINGDKEDKDFDADTALYGKGGKLSNSTKWRNK
jgi:hypothetical protein